MASSLYDVLLLRRVGLAGVPSLADGLKMSSRLVSVEVLAGFAVLEEMATRLVDLE